MSNSLGNSKIKDILAVGYKQLGKGYGFKAAYAIGVFVIP